MHKPAVLITATVLAALTLAACGGGSNTNTSTTGNASASVAGTPGAGASSTSSAALHVLALKYAQCMRANGVPKFPDPGSGGGGLQIAASKTAGSGTNLTVNGVSVNAPAFRSAMQKCQKDLPKRQPLSAAQIAQLKTKAIAFSKCMRANGVPNFPDPQITVVPGGRGIGVRMGAGPDSGINPQSPAFQAASQKCGGKQGFAIRVGAGAGAG